MFKRKSNGENLVEKDELSKKYKDSQSWQSNTQDKNDITFSLTVGEIFYNCEILTKIKEILKKLVDNDSEKDDKFHQIWRFLNTEDDIIHNRNLINAGDYFDAGDPGYDESDSHMAVQDLYLYNKGYEEEFISHFRKQEYTFSMEDFEDFRELVSLVNELKLENKKTLSLYMCGKDLNYFIKLLDGDYYNVICNDLNKYIGAAYNKK